MDLDIFNVKVKDVTSEIVEHTLEIGEYIVRHHGCTRDFCNKCLIFKIHMLTNLSCGLTSKQIILFHDGDDAFEKVDSRGMERTLAAAKIIKREYMRQSFDTCDIEV